MSIAPNNSTSVLCWPKKVLSADDLRRHLTSQRELLLLPRTIVTPLAADELKAKGIRVLWQVNAGTNEANVGQSKTKWFYVQDRFDALFSSVLQALDREGIALTAAASAIVPFAEMLIANDAGGIAVVAEPELICCMANKFAGIRAAAVMNVMQVSRARKMFAPNLFAFESNGKTFFELKQMVKLITADRPKCNEDVAKKLTELDGHAHR